MQHECPSEKLDDGLQSGRVKERAGRHGSLLQGQRDLLGYEGAALDGVQQLLGAFLRPRGYRDDHLRQTPGTVSAHRTA